MRHRRGVDSRPGRPFRVKGLPFGEHVLHVPPGAAKESRLEPLAAGRLDWNRQPQRRALRVRRVAQPPRGGMHHAKVGPERARPRARPRSDGQPVGRRARHRRCCRGALPGRRSRPPCAECICDAVRAACTCGNGLFKRKLVRLFGDGAPAPPRQHPPTQTPRPPTHPPSQRLRCLQGRIVEWGKARPKQTRTY